MKYARSLLNVDTEHGKHSSSKGLLVGELAESVLDLLVSLYIRETGWEARGFHSTVLKDLHDIHASFRTELDYTIVSPTLMLTLECKSYKGSITVKDKCTLVRGSRESDVYSQSVLHHKHLKLYAEQFLLPGKRIPRIPVFASVFLFSDSKVSDARTVAEKKCLSLLSSGSLFNYLDALRSAYSKPVFDYKRACNVFTKLENSEILHAQHASFVGYKQR